MKNKNQKGTDEYQLVVFDLYDIIIDFLERKNFIDKCYDFEKQRGFGRIVKAVSNSMKVSEMTAWLFSIFKSIHLKTPLYF